MEPTGHTGRTRLPTKSTARRLPNLAVACGLLLQALAGAAAADVCTEFRIALALEDASSEAYDTLAEKAKKKAGKDAWKVNWWDTPELQAASDAIEEARHRSEAAAEGVRQTVDGEVAAAMIDAMKVAAEKMALAHNKMSTWFARPGTPPVDVVDTSRAARDATERAYRDSVKAFCDAR